MALSLSSINSTETSSSACTWNPLPALKDIYQREIKSSEREKLKKGNLVLTTELKT